MLPPNAITTYSRPLTMYTAGAPFAPPELLPAHRVEKDLVVAELVLPAGHGVDARLDEERERLAFHRRQRDERDARARVGGLEASRELERGNALAAPGRFHEVRVEQIVELVVKNQVTPPIAAGQLGRLWENGRIAMDIAGPERAMRFRERLRFEWAAAPLPVATRTRLRSNAAQGSGLAMGANAKEIEAGWLFISEMLSADNLAEMVGKPARGVPGRPSAREALIYSDRAPLHANLFVEGAEAAACLAVSDFDEFQLLIAPATDALYTGARPVADVMRELAPKVDSLLRF